MVGMYCYLHMKRTGGCGCPWKSVHNRFCHNCLLWRGRYSLSPSVGNIMSGKWTLKTTLFCCRGWTMHCTSNWCLDLPCLCFQQLHVQHLVPDCCVILINTSCEVFSSLYWAVMSLLFCLATEYTSCSSPYRHIPDHWLIKKKCFWH